MSKTNKHDKYDEPGEDYNLDTEFASDRNPSPTLSRAATQEGYTTERFKAGHRKASIFTMVVLAAGCVVLGLLYYQAMKNLHSTRDNLATVKQQNGTLESQLKTVQVAGPAAPATPTKSNSQAGVTVKIPELGLQYQDNGQFNDLFWVVDAAGSSPILNLGSHSVYMAESKYLNSQTTGDRTNQCGIGALGTISVTKKTNLKSDSKDAQLSIDRYKQDVKSGNAIELDDSYLSWTYPQMGCSNSDSVNKQAVARTDTVRSFLKALQPIK